MRICLRVETTYRIYLSYYSDALLWSWLKVDVFRLSGSFERVALFLRCITFT